MKCKSCGKVLTQKQVLEHELALDGCRKGYCSRECCYADYPDPNNPPQCPCW